VSRHIEAVLPQAFIIRRVLTPILLALILSGFVSCGGGGGSTNSPGPSPNPVPSIASLSPSSVTAGAAAQTLTINGTNFLSNSTVTYYSVSHTATFVSSTQLTIALTAGDQAAAGSYAVVVTNPSPGGGASNSMSFTVNPPTITSVSLSCNPTSIAGTQTSQCAATVSGTGNYSSAVTWSATAGTISNSGFFTAASNSGTITVTAKSAQDPTKSGTTTITITTWTSYNNSQLQVEVGIPPFGQPTQCVVTNPANGQTKVEIQLWDPTTQQFFPEFDLVIYDNSVNASLPDWFEANVDINGILAANNTFASQQLGNGQSALVQQSSIPPAYAALNGPVADAYFLSNTTARVLGIAQSQVNNLFNMGYNQQSITILEMQILGATQF